jgi:hypothetical protein
MRVGNKPRLKKHPELQLRMGIHSGPVSGVIDATGKANVAGAASISHSGSWTAAMPDTFCSRSTSLKISRNTLTGSRTCMNLASVKSNMAFASMVNLYTEELGNPAVPEKLKAARVAAAARKNGPRCDGCH